MTAAQPEPSTAPIEATPLIAAAPPAPEHQRSSGGAGLPMVGRAAAAVALGMGSALAVPLAAAAAPAPCEQAQDYAAQSGAQVLHLNKLDLRPAGGDEEPTTDIGVGEAKSALIADASINAAAVTRLLDVGGSKAPGRALVQSAPPNHKQPVRRAVHASEEGPFALGDGALRARARWEPGMACGATTGDATRAEAALAKTAVGGDLLRVPGKLASLSTTALDRDTRSVATAGVTAGSFELLDGAVRVTVVRPPTLTARMSTRDGGEIRYVPAVLEVSGDGIETTRLATPGDHVQLAIGEDAAEPDATGEPESATLGDLVSGLTKRDKLPKGAPLPLPAVPGLPPVSGPAPESAPAAGSGTRLHITLGDVRQATAGHSIAARATAFSVVLTQGSSPTRDKQGYGDKATNRSGTVLDLDVGVLEAAAVAPPPGAGGVEAVSAGGGGGLPITGPRVDVLAMTGVTLLVAGVAAVAFGLRRRRFRPRS